MEELNFGNGGGGRDPLGEDGVENPVDFLSELRNPCLICGVDVEIDILVKQEVGDFEENFGEGGSSPPSQVRGVGGGGGNLDHNVFHWFLKWFRVDIVKKGNKRLVDRGWDGHGGDILRFCGGCKGELIKLLDLQKEVDGLLERIENGLGEVKGKMEGCEGTFQSNGIYERDDRYKRVRSRIVKIGPTKGRPRKDSSVKPVEKETGSKRKSSRKPVPVSRFNPTTINSSHDGEAGDDDDELPDDNFSELMLLSSDTGRLRDHLIIAEEDEDQLDIKPDIQISDSNINLISCSTPPPPPPLPSPLTEKVREAVKLKKKAGLRTKSPKIKKKPEIKSKSTSTPSKNIQRPSRKSPKVSAVLDGGPGHEEDDNYYLNDDNDIEDNLSLSSSDNEDKPGGSRKHLQRKKRKVKDEDFVLDDDVDDNLSDDDLDWSSTNEPRRKYKYTLDPTTNQITLGPHTFTLSSSSPDQVICTECQPQATMKHNNDCMYRHITKYHSNRFTCPNYDCTFKGSSLKDVHAHFKTRHEGIPRRNPRIPCKICGKPIQNTKRCRLNHEWTHLSKEEKEEVVARDDPELLPDQLKRRWQCDECGKGFVVPSELKRHKERYHDQSFQNVKSLCAECGETFVDLEGHRRRVHGRGEGGKEAVRWWECTEGGCGKRFRKVGLLTKHKDAVHRGIRPWGCTLCTRRFVKEEGLKKHMDLHLGRRDWGCEVEGCGAAFARKAHLQRHTRIYHEEGARPRRKVFLRGPTVLGVGFKKEELVREGTYYPPSALKSWAKGRVPGHLLGKEGTLREEVEGDGVGEGMA